MSSLTRDTSAHRLRQIAPIFAALGDETRLAIVARLGEDSLLSIARLTEGSSLTRQAVTKHLRVLQDVGVVRGVRKGRENLFELEPRTLNDARRTLDAISRQWDDTLARLKSYVERNP